MILQNDRNYPPLTILESSAAAALRTTNFRHSLLNRVNTDSFSLCDYEEYHHLGCDAISCYRFVPISQWSPPSSLYMPRRISHAGKQLQRTGKERTGLEQISGNTTS